MEIPVVIEPAAGDGFVAKIGEPLSASAAGATRDDSLRNLRQAEWALTMGAPGMENPWIKFAGMFKDEPMFDDVRRIIAENRAADNADPDFL